MRAFLLLSCLLLATTSHSRPLDYYVGGAIRGQWLHEVTGHDDRQTRDLDPGWIGGDAPGAGLQFETGLIRKYFTGYLAFRHDFNSARRHEEYPFAANLRIVTVKCWNSDRFLLGIRTASRDRGPHSSQFVLGGALTYGWLKRSESLRTRAGNPTDYDQTEHGRQTSDGTFGWLAETGLVFRGGGHLRYSYMLQAESFNMSLSHGGLGMEPVENVFVFALQFGVHYLP